MIELRQRIIPSHRENPKRPLDDIFFEGRRVGIISHGPDQPIVFTASVPAAAIKAAQKAVAMRDGTNEPRKVLTPPSVRLQ